jgi:hypothetical protein
VQRIIFVKNFMRVRLEINFRREAADGSQTFHVWTCKPNIRRIEDAPRICGAPSMRGLNRFITRSCASLATGYLLFAPSAQKKELLNKF